MGRLSSQFDSLSTTDSTPVISVTAKDLSKKKQVQDEEDLLGISDESAIQPEDYLNIGNEQQSLKSKAFEMLPVEVITPNQPVIKKYGFEPLKEFGQGVAQTAACDTNAGITVTPAASFVNASSGGSFNFTTVAFSNIDATCANKVFTLKAYGDSSATPVTLNTDSTPFTYATFNFHTDNLTSPNVTGSGYLNSGNAGTFTISFNGTQATEVASLTIVSNTSPAFGPTENLSNCPFTSMGIDKLKN
jgi:hypothetical protein